MLLHMSLDHEKLCEFHKGYDELQKVVSEDLKKIETPYKQQKRVPFEPTAVTLSYASAQPWLVVPSHNPVQLVEVGQYLI